MQKLPLIALLLASLTALAQTSEEGSAAPPAPADETTPAEGDAAPAEAPIEGEQAAPEAPAEESPQSESSAGTAESPTSEDASTAETTTPSDDNAATEAAPVVDTAASAEAAATSEDVSTAETTTPSDDSAATEAASAANSEVEVGSEVGGWRIVTLRGERRLPDGRVTKEGCGFLQDVVVEKGPRLESAVLEVPCVTSGGGLSAGESRLRFIDLVEEGKIAAPPAAEDVAPPQEGEDAAAEAPLAPEALEEGEAAETSAETEAAAPTSTEAEADIAAETPAEEPVPEEPTPEEPQKAFLKGELTRFGDVQFQNRRSSFGVALGGAILDGVGYAVLRPDVNIHSGSFSLGLGAPLRFEVFNLTQLDANSGGGVNTIFSGFGQFRGEDWDQVEDFLRPLRYLTWGRKEDRLYLDVNRIRAVSIGHGQLVRRYSPTIDIDEDNLFTQVNGYTDIGGFELMAGPFPVPRLVGGLVFAKPLGLFRDDYLSKSLSIGASWVTDLNVPTVLTTDTAPSDGRTLLAVDEAGNFDYANKGAFTGDMVHGFGVDAEVKLVKWEFIDLKTYVDYSQLMFPGSEAGGFSSFSDGGFTLGTLLRMSFGETPVRDFEDEDDLTRAGQKPREMRAIHALRLRMEGRAFGPQYLPSYFDGLYEADKLQFGFGSTPLSLRASLPTKVAYLASQAGQPWRVGTYLEGSYTFVDWLGLTAVYEDAIDTEGNAVPAARNFALHAETGKALSILQLFATYHYRHFEDASKLLQVATDNELIYLGGRLQLLPILFVNLGAQRAFRTGFLDDDLPDQRRTLTGAPEGSEQFRFSSIGLQNTWAGTVDVELGWQF